MKLAWIIVVCVVCVACVACKSNAREVVIYTSVEPPAQRESRFRLRLPSFGRKTEAAGSEGRRSRKKKRKITTA